MLADAFHYFQCLVEIGDQVVGALDSNGETDQLVSNPHFLSLLGLIVAQINTTPDNYSGYVDYNHAPWVDWGPYLWAAGPNTSPGNLLKWCDYNSQFQSCLNLPSDVRYGDPSDQNDWWGDHTHPAYQGQFKVAQQLVEFITGGLPSAQAYISNWVAPWKGL